MQPDFEILNKYIEYGFTLLAASSNGKAFLNWRGGKDHSKENSEIHTSEELRQAIANGIKCFRFYPAERDLIVIDIDCHKDENGVVKVNGMKNFENLIAQAPEADRQGIFNDFHRLIVFSPNGTHLYFKADAVLARSTLNGTIAPAVEIKGGVAGGSWQFINACGSVKEGKPYQLDKGIPVFDFGLCTDLPLYFRRMALKTPKLPKPKFTPHPTYSQKTYKRRSAEDIVESASKSKYSQTGRENFAYMVGKYAGNEYTTDELLIALEAHPLYRRQEAEHSGYANCRYQIERGKEQYKEYRG